MKTDEPASTADGSSAPRGTSRAPAPPAGPPPLAAPAAEKGTRQDEAVALLRLAARLKTAYPSIDPSVVDQAVATARGPFQLAKVRTYVPILVERRVRVLLGAIDREEASRSPAAVGDSSAARRTTAGTTAEQPAGSPSRSPLRVRWIPAMLRPAPASDVGRVGERS
ncbi:hypothetical protein [Streptomyces sp. NPDC002685]|uniref:three-helix bundle dimerization domain-containing protein n=1 Tax=Streptomyces sp. NPDC002685 TaxID=3154540 RepID=UPI003329DA3B